MRIDLNQFEVWFVTGSQHLYGPQTLEKVAAHSAEIAQALTIELERDVLSPRSWAQVGAML